MNNLKCITAELKKMLHRILPISAKRLKNLVAIIVGILLSKSAIISILYIVPNHLDKTFFISLGYL
jgi:hypothetical protein